MPVETAGQPEKESRISLSGPHPRLITGWLLQFLQWKFSNIQNLIDPALHSEAYLWQPRDLENRDYGSGILIEPATRLEPTTMGHRPALLLRGGPQKPMRGLGSIGGNRRQMHHNLIGDGHDPNKEPTVGQEAQNDWIEGSHTVFCIHTDPAAAESLGIEVWWSLLDYRGVARKDCRLKRIDVPGGISETSQVKEVKGHWATSFVVNYIYERTSLILNEAPYLKSYSFHNNVFN